MAGEFDVNCRTFSRLVLVIHNKAKNLSWMEARLCRFERGVSRRVRLRMQFDVDRLAFWFRAIWISRGGVPFRHKL